MYKSVIADKDAYITNKVIGNLYRTGSNVGSAATLDLFKLYGATRSGSLPNVELSRLLIHFDLSSLKDLIAQNLLDVSDPSFWCKIVLKDVYGGQPTPSNFTVDVFPLSGTFEEGIGRDVVYYSDSDTCNWLSSSLETPWFSPGCDKQCIADLGTGDYITSSISIASTKSSQHFKTGLEDLNVDVTSVISATLSGELPDCGFRLSFSDSIESDARTYFVKRFGSRTVYDESKRPRLVFGFDNSMSDDTQNLTFDATCSLFLRNYSLGELTNILSGSSLDPVTGSNCLLLKLTTEVSGGTYDYYATGSQFSYGSTSSAFVSGTYVAQVSLLSSDPILSSLILASSSIRFKPVWTSLDQTIVYLSGSSLTFRPPSRTGTLRPKTLVVNALGLKDSYSVGEEAQVRVNIFDQSSPLIKVVKVPVELPGIVLKNVFYQIRNATTDEIVIPYDAPKNSTKVSSDSEGMFFTLDFSHLVPNNVYVVDVAIDNNGLKSVYKDASPNFRVTV